MTNKVEKLKINVGNQNDLINKAAKLTIKNIRNNLIGCVKNLEINRVGNDLI